MAYHPNAVMGIGFFVHFLLLLGTNRLCGYPPQAGRCVVAALLGSVHSGLCLLRGFSFLASPLWRFAVLIIMSVAAFGISGSTVGRCAIFLLLTVAMEGITPGAQSKNLWKLPVGAIGVFLLSYLGFGGKPAGLLVPVELSYGGKDMEILALRDTGNTLCDPVTGAPVLVVGAEIASLFTGLTQQQLQSPLENITKIPGLRLIPYRTVGQEQGMLLALRFPEVKIGNWRGSSLVAFAPQKLSRAGKYQALTGGTV